MIFSPKSPCGRTKRNASASTYANQFSIAPPTSGPQYTSPGLPPMSRLTPPTIVSGTDVKPPRIRTGSAFRATSERLNCPPLLAPHMMPATIATRPATDHTISQIVLSGMPMDSAASWSSATARSARPMRVRWKKTARMATSTAAVAAADISSWLICTPATMNERSGMPTSSFLTLAPHTISPKPSRKKLRPMVAMNRMIASWFTSGRSTTRSMRKASPTITAIVITSATATGTPRSMSPTSVRAANSTITPWAKLKTPEALKMRTKPSATSEYIRPVATPPSSTSTRKAGEPAMSRNGPTKTPWRISVMARPEIGVEDRRGLAHVLGWTVGDLAPVVQDGDTVGDVHDHAHVVLDERDRRAELAVHVEDEARHVLLLLDVHAGHRLVEQQQLGLGGERAPELHALLQSIGQLAGRRLADGLDLEGGDHALDEGAGGQLLAPGGGPPDRVEQEVPAHLQQPARHEVVEHAHALEERDVLEGARHPELGHVGRRQPRAVAALEEDAALVGMVEAADDVEQRGLARAVGPDDGEDLPALDVQAHAAQREQSAKAHADPLHLEQGPGCLRGHRTACAAPTSRMRTSARMVPVRPSS